MPLKTDELKITNYRPISVITPLAKMFEKAIKKIGSVVERICQKMMQFQY